jgi:hypothetical protein
MKVIEELEASIAPDDSLNAMPGGQTPNPRR